MFGLYLTTRKLAAGFVVGACIQVLWIAYGLSTNQYGFVLSALGYGYFNLLGLYRWTRPKKVETEAFQTPSRIKFMGLNPDYPPHYWEVTASDGTHRHTSGSFPTEDLMVRSCVAIFGTELLNEKTIVLDTDRFMREKIFDECHRLITDQLRKGTK